MRRFLLLAAALLVGCGGGANPAAQNDLARSRTLWRSQGLTRYAYTVQAYGFLPRELLGPWRVEVRDGVSTVTPLGGAAPDSPADAKSVDALFAAVEGALGRPGARVTVAYDPGRGFPGEIAVDPLPAAVDDEWGYRVTALTPLP